MRWCFAYHDPEPGSGAWTLPRGFAAALRAEGVELWSYPFVDPSTVTLPTCEELIQRQISVLLVFYAGRSEALEQELLRIRQGTDLLLVNELGDEPQTRPLNAVRVQLSDLSLSPDAASVAFWQGLGAHCVWFTHWADTALFHPDASVPRLRRVVTTAGRRRYTLLLQALLGPWFVNRRCVGAQNTQLYNSGLIAFQYARWQEVTRRVFEAAACGSCVVTNRLPAGAAMEQLFEDGKSVVLYSNGWQLLSCLVQLLRQPERAARIGARGQELVLQSHTQHSRAKQLISLVKKLPGRDR